VIDRLRLPDMPADGSPRPLPMMVAFNTCDQFFRTMTTLPMAPVTAVNREDGDVDTIAARPADGPQSGLFGKKPMANENLVRSVTWRAINIF